MGTVVWLASEAMFFGGLFAAYFTLRAGARQAEWPPPDAHLEAVVAGVFTAVLVASSGTIQLGVRAIRAGDRRQFRRMVLITALLAMAFLGNQWREWQTVEFGPSDHTYGSAFFVMTGFHGLHVLGGVLAMAVVLGRSASDRFGTHATPAVEVVSLYWHFVDLVWLAMFVTLFVVA